MNKQFIILIILLSFSILDGVEGQDFNYLKSLRPYNIQMHIHGHSHHNAAEKPGSMQWHTYQAKDHGVDVIWWTEHDGMLNQRKDFIIDFKDAYVDGYGNVIFNRQSNFLPEFLEIKQINGIAEVKILNDSLLHLRLNHLIGHQASLSYTPRTNKGKLAGFRLPRPVSSNAVMRLYLKTDFGGMDNAVKIKVLLSWHISNRPHQHAVEYFFSDTVHSKSTRIYDDATIQFFLPVDPEGEYHTLFLYDDVNALNYGKDNTITDIQVELLCKDRTSISTYLGNLSITSLDPEPEYQMGMIDEFSEEYERVYQVKGIAGIEYSPFRTDYISPHFNLFLPQSRFDFLEILEVFPDNQFDYRELINRVHLLNGVVSFNHIFGTSIYKNGEYPAHIQDQMVDSLAALYMSRNLFNADILEVGYMSRGGVNLKNHLEIWDIFTANGFFLYGNGTTDAHGGLWNIDIPNPFTSWVWAENSMDTSLLNALDSGRFYFGTLQNKIQKFSFSIDEFKMGDRKYTDRKTGNLQIFLEPIPYNYTFRLIQGSVNYPGNDVHYIKNITFDPESPPIIDLSSSCFIRLEVEGNEDGVRIFSNPIVLLKQIDYQNTIYETRISNDDGHEERLFLYDPFPNPASDEVWIPFELMNESDLSFNIISSTGQIIREIHLGTRTKGEYKGKLAAVYWDLYDRNNIRVTPGIYMIASDDIRNRMSKKIIVR